MARPARRCLARRVGHGSAVRLKPVVGLAVGGRTIGALASLVVGPTFACGRPGLGDGFGFHAVGEVADNFDAGT